MAAQHPPYDSVFLIGFGGPTQQGEAYAFVKGVVGNRPGSEARIQTVAAHYDSLGGMSPYNAWTQRQADALTAGLVERGRPLPVYVGMRYWHPTVRDVLSTMYTQGRRHALGVILSPLACALSWDRYQETVTDSQQALAGAAPQVSYLEPWHAQPGYLNALADCVRTAYETLDASRRAEALLIFTAHSIPLNGCPACREGRRTCTYAAQYTAVAAAVAARLGLAQYRLAFQSRASFASPWLEPDIKDVLRDLQTEGIRDVVVAPVGFLCDHIEVLYDLDHDARATADACGIRFTRASTVGTHPAFIAMLRDLLIARITEAAA